MIIIPAIDLKDGKCVRLYRGDFSTVHQVAESHLETALSFEKAGAGYIHMVDLDGALTGNGKNAGIVCEVAAKTRIPVEVGGGVRNMERIDYYLSNGVSRVIIGTAALRDRKLVADAVRRYGGRIAVGIDAMDRKVKTQGWTDSSEIDFIEFAKMMEDLGVENIIYTDISRDGMLEGPNFSELSELSAAVSSKITASGGIRDIADIKELREMGLYGAICGKSVYSGTLDLTEAVRLTSGKTEQ